MASAKVYNSKERVRRRRSREAQHKESTPPPCENDFGNCDGISYRDTYKLDDMELKSTLGTGTFGRVVLARHKGTRDFFALKVMAIAEVVRLKQVEHVQNEKEVLTMVKHPFIVYMFWTDHNDRFLYMLLEFLCGGELFSYLRNAGRFNNTTSNFYAAEIVSALDYLHSLSIVYRDLKPENLLLDRDGHLKLTDFGFAKKLDDRTWTLCGTPEYLAPEIIQSKGHNRAVDWWALGILVYEMLVGGAPFTDDNVINTYEKILLAKIQYWPSDVERSANYPPFFDDNPFGIYEKILAGKIEWPKHIDAVGKDLVKKLLVQDRTKRLGNMKNGSEDVKKHRWFRHLDWDEVYNRKLPPPIVPDISHEGDTSNFDDYPDDNWQNAPPVSDRDLAPFIDF